MELKEFIKKTLEEIDSAIEEASVSGHVTVNNNSANGISFDIGVVVAETNTVSGDVQAGLDLKVVKLGGTGEQQNSVSAEHVNRVKFNLFMT